MRGALRCAAQAMLCSTLNIPDSERTREILLLFFYANCPVNICSPPPLSTLQRTQMEHPYSLAEKNPEKFATSIIEKLHAVKKQLDCGERLERFHRAQAEDFPAAPPRGPPLAGAVVAAPSASVSDRW